MLLIVGFLFMVLIFAFVTVFGGDVGGAFMDLPSAALMVVSLFFFFFVTKSGKILGRYFKTSFKKEHVYSETELASLSTALKNTNKFILTVGGFGFLAGIILSLFYLENKNMLGANVAVSLITVIYSLALSCFVFFPVQVWAENKINLLKDEA